MGYSKGIYATVQGFNSDISPFLKAASMLFADKQLPDVVDIGQWSPYTQWANPDQISLQKQFLFDTGVHNGKGAVKFILTKQIKDLEERLQHMSSLVKVVDTTVALEDEVFYTNKIEGAKTTRIRTSQIHAGEYLNISNYKSERMILNGFNAVEYITVYGRMVKPETLIRAWNTLVEDVCENENIRGKRFRTGNVCVGSFVPVDFSEVEQLMTDYCHFYNNKFLDEYPFIKAALCHYVFETIHPFCDGNGRLGRLLMNNYLISREIDSAKAVSISMAIDEMRSHYDVAFIDSENEENDCTPFIQYMLERMFVAYSKALEVQSS